MEKVANKYYLQSQKWAKAAKITKAAGQVVGIALMAASSVMAGYNAFKYSQDDEIELAVFSSIESAAWGLSALATFGSLFIKGAVFLPFVGKVLAIIGLVFMLFATFWPREPEPTPQQLFVRDHCVPLIEALEEPPEDWLGLPPPEPTDE